MGIDIARPLCGIQRDINRPSGGFGRQPIITPPRSGIYAGVRERSEA